MNWPNAAMSWPLWIRQFADTRIDAHADRVKLREIAQALEQAISPSSERTSRDAVIEECARQCYGLTISPGQPIAVISLYGEVATKCAERIRALKGENK